ncbi:MAG: MBL fold metallo-hydrolase [Candidatus Binataceae bacterium]
MAITNRESGTSVNEIADGIYPISTPVSPDLFPGGFTFNQYLIVDEAPLLFHTGLRKLFPLVREAVASVIAVERLRYISFSHVEADECGALNDWLAAAPNALPLCGRLAASVSIEDLADRMPREMADREILSLGSHQVQWLDSPHTPHAWECGFLMEQQTRTLLCGDLFTQSGDKHAPLTESDVFGPSEAFRKRMDYFSHAPNSGALIERLAACEPATLACMHGSAWRGDGAGLLRRLADALTR